MSLGILAKGSAEHLRDGDDGEPSPDGRQRSKDLGG